MHPVHVSILSIDFSDERKQFDVFVRLYYDDFLLDSGMAAGESSKLVFSADDSFTREYLMNYVTEKIRIFVNNRPVTVKLEKSDMSENELRMNLSVDAVKKINTIKVQNMIMTSLYSDQANMIIVKVNEFEEGVKLTPEETEKTFNIN
jgi:hypothetical protein